MYVYKPSIELSPRQMRRLMIHLLLTTVLLLVVLVLMMLRISVSSFGLTARLTHSIRGTGVVVVVVIVTLVTSLHLSAVAEQLIKVVR